MVISGEATSLSLGDPENSPGLWNHQKEGMEEWRFYLIGPNPRFVLKLSVLGE